MKRALDHSNRDSATKWSKISAYSDSTSDLVVEDNNSDDDFDFGIDEDAEAARVLEESRKRREEILRKYSKPENENNNKNNDGSNKNDNDNAVIDVPNEDDAKDIIEDDKTSFIGLTENGNEIEAERQAVEQEESRNREKYTIDMFSLQKDVFIPASASLADSKDDSLKLRNTLDDVDQHLQGNFDDTEGYYKGRVGEMLLGHYRVVDIVGKGVFSTVLKCRDLSNSSKSAQNLDPVGDNDPLQSFVAIKLIRNNDVMRKSSEKERSILLELSKRDPDNRRHCVKLLTVGDHRNHVAFVFEYLPMNLRETLKKYGKDVGVNISAVRLYGRQLFSALRLLYEAGIVHADIKLDNILCSADLKHVKLCDFGSAFRLSDSDNHPTPYLVSRFYRAPEVILGLSYDCAVDLWSICVSLYELFTGHVMFPGQMNNDMLRLMMAFKGRFPNRMIKNHIRDAPTREIEVHFTPDLQFKQKEKDPVTGNPTMRLVTITRPTRDLSAMLRSCRSSTDEAKLVNSFIDLLDKGLNLDPSKRISVSDALKHQFFSSKF